ncbi:hypothetical protein XA68_11123 [Ophiocordyceps unilateralis]|uniref:Uncharacterized protein n=1 Tax=Ophiocordyceps unilateralis TaxID=268505 RepID=A0A2A9P280_OPHUN|nr:hypothetical protein XA68_11123 [Ophiocordyceps unilateralis]
MRAGGGQRSNGSEGGWWAQVLSQWVGGGQRSDSRGAFKTSGSRREKISAKQFLATKSAGGWAATGLPLSFPLSRDEPDARVAPMLSKPPLVLFARLCDTPRLSVSSERAIADDRYNAYDFAPPPHKRLPTRTNRLYNFSTFAESGWAGAKVLCPPFLVCYIGGQV